MEILAQHYKSIISKKWKTQCNLMTLELRQSEKPEKFNLWQPPDSRVLIDEDTCQNFKKKSY